MSERPKKIPCSVGLLAHVGASRRAPRKSSYIPGPKTGDYSCPAEVKLFQGSKIPPYVVVSSEQKPQHMVVDFQDSVFVADCGNRNEVGINEKLCVGYKGDFAFIILQSKFAS